MPKPPRSSRTPSAPPYIARTNDLGILFNKLGIDTLCVLEAAHIKWTVLPFRPGMGGCVAGQVLELMVRNNINPAGARVLILGLAFKENCPDLRNTRVMDIVHGLEVYNVQIDAHDPWVDAAEAEHEYGLTPIETPEQGVYDAVVPAVDHDQFRVLGREVVCAFGKPQANIVCNMKYALPPDVIHGRL